MRSLKLNFSICNIGMCCVLTSKITIFTSTAASQIYRRAPFLNKSHVSNKTSLIFIFQCWHARSHLPSECRLVFLVCVLYCLVYRNFVTYTVVALRHPCGSVTIGVRKWPVVTPLPSNKEDCLDVCVFYFCPFDMFNRLGVVAYVQDSWAPLFTWVLHCGGLDIKIMSCIDWSTPRQMAKQYEKPFAAVGSVKQPD